MGKIVFGIASTEFQAEAVVNELRVADFIDEDISVLAADKLATASRPLAGPPGIGGGAFGWLPNIAVITVPGAGPFIASGAISPALKAAAVGGSNRSLVETLSGMGLDQNHARRLERKIRQGSILVAVQTLDNSPADRARSILEQAGILEIVSSAEFSANASGDESSACGFDFDAPSNAAT